MKEPKEWKATHRIVDQHGMDIEEDVMMFNGKYYSRDCWFHHEVPETDKSLREMGWHAVSSFREHED